ncbi:hypothetical protein HII12_005357 [Brettanomyces bruxellensis]|uniref:DNA 3'-phosphatase n=1 Tax=Dekkera bruxellensis TaxID=5007 RepID=A0A8H6EPZ8_DEKBR|nr:hypothetical protein HII12_005357 [Brettanomyces bruxellensis]
MNNPVQNEDESFPPIPKSMLIGGEVYHYQEIRYRKNCERIGSHMLRMYNDKFLSIRLGDKSLTGKKYSIAGFDMDETIITTQSGTRFGHGAWDWCIKYPEVVSRLKELETTHSNDDTIKVIAIFTNQGAINNTKRSKSLSGFTHKISSIIKKLSTLTSLPIVIYAATRDPQANKNVLAKKAAKIARKPDIGMFQQLLNDINATKEDVSYQDSFFCGDAAGRPGDFSECDIGIAKKIGVKFYTPEQYFLDVKEK